MPPTVCHSMRASSATAVAVQRTARHATQSSKSRVNRDLCLAHGTDSTSTPCSGQETRRVLYSRKHIDLARSMARHDLGPGGLS